MATPFARISPKLWRLHSRVHLRRRQRLLHGLGFVAIVHNMVKQARVLTYERKKIRDFPGYYRAEITLKVVAETVDLFHNSAAGYRAQYYRSTRAGKIANDYALRKLVPRVIELLGKAHKRTCPPWWVEKSLRHPEAKLWIHQGQWLRSPKKFDRNLMVKRWLKANPKDRKRLLWNTLTPATEVRIDLKGAPLTLEGKPLSASLKPRRSIDIHEVGYT